MTGNATVVVVVSDHPDVAILSPRCSPRVLDNPIVLVVSSIMAIANDQDSMVKSSGGAICIVVHSASVAHEARSGGINSNRDGTNSANGLFQGVLIEPSDVDISCHLGSVVGGVVTAGVLHSIVGIGSFGVNATIGLDVLESILLPASFAAVVTVWVATVDKVLLGEGYERLGLAEPLSFQGTGGGEGPAGATLTLVLDRSHRSVLTPVDGIRYGFIIRGNEGFAGELLGFLVVVVGTILRQCQVGELVDTLFKVYFASLEEVVVFVDPGYVVLEDLETQSIFSCTYIGLSIGCLVGVPGFQFF